MPHTFIVAPLHLSEAPAPAPNGGCYYDTTLEELRFCVNGAWVGIGGSALPITIVAGDQIEFPLPGGGIGYIDFFRR